MSIRARETITECLEQVQFSVDHHAKIEALQTLISITKVSPSNRNLVAKSNGAISLLLELSKPRNNNNPEKVQSLAISVLFNLSLNPTLKQSLAQMDTIDHLNSLLVVASSAELSKLVASLLCSLAMLDKNKAKFGVAGTVQVLVKAVSGPRGPSTHYLLSSLSELIQFHGNCTLAVRSGAVQTLIGLSEVAENNDDISGTCLTALGLIARFHEGLEELKKTNQVVSRLLRILKNGSMMSKEGACEVLLRLFDDEGAANACVREALGLPEFANVVTDVSVRAGSGRVRDKAGLILKKINDTRHLT